LHRPHRGGDGDPAGVGVHRGRGALDYLGTPEDLGQRRVRRAGRQLPGEHLTGEAVEGVHRVRRHDGDLQVRQQQAASDERPVGPGTGVAATEDEDARHEPPDSGTGSLPGGRTERNCTVPAPEPVPGSARARIYSME
jgi:hypothetical protein